MTLPPHPLPNFEIQKYYQNEPRLNGVFNGDNLPNNNNNIDNDNIKSGASVINLDAYHDIGNHWVALYVNNKTITYFESSGVEHISKEIIKFIGNKQSSSAEACNNKIIINSSSAEACNNKIITNIFRIQAYDSIMCGYFCIRFIKFKFNGNSLTDYTNLFSPNDLKKKR